MKKTIMEIIACPMDKHYPLDLIELDMKDGEIVEGVITCSQCGRFYPIIGEIPIMLPDDFRDREKDLQLLTKWSHKLPEKVLYEGLPHHLNRG